LPRGGVGGVIAVFFLQLTGIGLHGMNEFATVFPEAAKLLELTYKDAILVISMRKPFDALAEGLQMKNGTGECTQIELFWQGLLEYPRELLPLLVQYRP